MAETDFVCSTPDERISGEQILIGLNRSASHGDPLAEALLRAHALLFGYPGLLTLSQLATTALSYPTLRLDSPMDRHGKLYFLRIPNVWIDLNTVWLSTLKRFLKDSTVAKKMLSEWGIMVPSHVRDHARWFLRCFEASLVLKTPVSTLLIGIANFRMDAALPGEFAINGSFSQTHRRTIKPDGIENHLRMQLRKARHPGYSSPFSPPSELLLAELEDPIERLISLSLNLRLQASRTTLATPMSTERLSAEQQRMIRVISEGGSVENQSISKTAWNSLLNDWPLVKGHFEADEQAAIEQWLFRNRTEVFTPFRYSKCGVFNLLPPSSAACPYISSPDLLNCPIEVAIKWTYILFLLKAGLRASDLYSISCKNLSGVGSPELTLTVPFTKTTGRRSYVVGISLTPRDHFSVGVVIGRLQSLNMESTNWFSIITGKDLPPRWQYDFAYQDFRRAIAPPGQTYLRTHIPRHIFATAFGLWYTGLILENWKVPFFRLWTDDPGVSAINESAIPKIYSAFPDALSLVNQIMGHKTPEQFIETYCHSWPLILAAMAEARRPNHIPWDLIEGAFLNTQNESPPASG